jgi:hypothetical protein
MFRWLEYLEFNFGGVVGVVTKLCFITSAVCKVRGLAAMRRFYAEGGGDCYA